MNLAIMVGSGGPLSFFMVVSQGVSGMEYPIVSRDPARQARYVAMREAGESHNMAEILATGKCPGFTTDDMFIKGRFCSDRGKNGEDELRRIRKAEAAGVSTTGKEYFSSLADYPDDPTAWAGSRDEVREIARRKGMTVHGMVEYQPPEVEPIPEQPYRVGEDLIRNELDARMSENPGADRESIREHLLDLRSGTIDPNPLRVGDYEAEAFWEE